MLNLFYSPWLCNKNYQTLQLFIMLWIITFELCYQRFYTTQFTTMADPGEFVWVLSNTELIWNPDWLVPKPNICLWHFPCVKKMSAAHVNTNNQSIHGVLRHKKMSSHTLWLNQGSNDVCQKNCQTSKGAHPVELFSLNKNSRSDNGYTKPDIETRQR